MFKRQVLVALSSLLLASTAAFADDLTVSSRPTLVTVFPDGASITRALAVDIPAGAHSIVLPDLPLNADPASIRVAGQGTAGLTLGSIDAREPPPSSRPRPDLVVRLERLRDDRLELDDRIAAEQLRKRAAEALMTGQGLGAGNETRPSPEEARALFATALEAVGEADRAIREAERRKRAIDREIAAIELDLRAQPPRRMEARIQVEAVAPVKADLTVTYSVRGARWAPAYDARLTTTGPMAGLELVRRAEIRQETGEDWTDVELTVSTARTSRGGGAPHLPPLIVRFQEPPAVAATRQDGLRMNAPAAPVAPPMMVPMTAGVVQERVRVAEAEAAVDMGGFQAQFRIPGRATIASAGAPRALRLTASQIQPQLVARAVPSVDATAYLEAHFRHGDEVPLMPGRVSLYRDGLFAGLTQITAATRDDPIRLGFGADDLVRVEYHVVRRTDGSTGIITTSRTEEREFRIAIRNGATSARRVIIEDRVPVSEAQEIVVEPLAGMTAPTARDVRDRRGVVEWSFDLAAGTSRDIRHGWRVRWPTDRPITPISGRL